MADLHSLKRCTRSMAKIQITDEANARSKTFKRSKAKSGSATTIRPCVTYLDLPRELRHKILDLALDSDAFLNLQRFEPPYSLTLRSKTLTDWDYTSSYTSPLQYARVWQGLAICRRHAHLEDLVHFLRPVLKRMEIILSQWLALWSARGGINLAHLDDKGEYVCVWYRHSDTKCGWVFDSPPGQITYVKDLMYLSDILDDIASDLGLEWHTNRSVTQQLRVQMNLDGKGKCTKRDHAFGRQVYCVEGGNAYWCSIWS